MKEIKDFSTYEYYPESYVDYQDTYGDGYLIVDGLTTATSGGKLKITDMVGSIISVSYDLNESEYSTIPTATINLENAKTLRVWQPYNSSLYLTRISKDYISGKGWSYIFYGKKCKLLQNNGAHSYTDDLVVTVYPDGTVSGDNPYPTET